MLIKMNQKLMNALIESNPWWRTGKIEVEVKKRELNEEIDKYIKKKQIIAITGLRRVGKTTLLYGIIKKLLLENSPKSILYFSFDDFEEQELEEIIDAHIEINNQAPKFIFFDEIQKINNWSNKIKRIYDNKKVKIFVSGSESLFIIKKTKETLAGRIYEFKLNPLSFKEYLQFRGIKEDYLLYQKEIKKAFKHYLKSGGFPELVEEEDPQVIREYLRNIIEKEVFMDIPKMFKIENPSLIKMILNIIIDNPGMILEINNLSKEIGISRQTISKYLFYLEAAQLIKKLYNFSKNISTSEKKLKKYYLTFSCLGLSYNRDDAYISKVVENVCVLHANAKFFWRTPQKDEVDMILNKEGILPVEIKYSNKVNIKPITKFMKKYNLKKGYVITRDYEGKEKNIEFIPLLKWLLSVKTFPIEEHSYTKDPDSFSLKDEKV